jgi:hypothetical protein
LKHIDTIHKFTISVLILILVQACSKESFTSQENASSAPSPNLNISYDCTIGNETVLENDSKLFYLKSSVPYGSTCQSENRTCRRGFFAGTYQYTTCDIDAPHSCLHNGATIAHGQSISAFLQSSVPYGQSCVQQTRTCNNGILSGSYDFTSCSVGVAASCTFNGSNLAHGASVTAFATSTVDFGFSCQSQMRTCNNGTLSGSYNYAGCAVDAPEACLFNGVTIPHGGSTPAYALDNAPFWTFCGDYLEIRTCYDGALSGNYPYSSCAD